MKFPNLFFLLALVVVGCTQQQSQQQSKSQPAPDLAAEEVAIRAANAQWLAAAKARDTDKAVSFWADDATILMPGAPPVVGKQAIRDYVAESFASPDFSITWTTDKVVVSRSGDMAYGTGVSQITFKGPGNKLVTQKNNGMGIWKKQPDGSWKVAIDIATPEPPANTNSAVRKK